MDKFKSNISEVNLKNTELNNGYLLNYVEKFKELYEEIIKSGKLSNDKSMAELAFNLFKMIGISNVGIIATMLPKVKDCLEGSKFERNEKGFTITGSNGSIINITKDEFHVDNIATEYGRGNSLFIYHPDPEKLYTAHEHIVFGPDGLPIELVSYEDHEFFNGIMVKQHRKCGHDYKNRKGYNKASYQLQEREIEGWDNSFDIGEIRSFSSLLNSNILDKKYKKNIDKLVEQVDGLDKINEAIESYNLSLEGEKKL